jgi:hypothetical protein
MAVFARERMRSESAVESLLDGQTYRGRIPPTELRQENRVADFPYTPQPASIKRFLSHVQSAGVPDKVTQKYLEKVGFKSTNDRYLIGVLKFVGFLDASGVPTKVWQSYRNKKTAGATLAAALRRCYADLFGTYPDAYRKDNEALRNYFSAHTKVAESTLGLIVSTFKTFCENADFEGEQPPETDEAATEPKTPLVPPKRTPPKALPTGLPAVNINIQLQLPATDDATIYDKLFAARKNTCFREEAE